MFYKKILQFTAPTDYETEMTMISKLSAEYDFIDVKSLGTSIFGKEIPCIKLGHGSKNIVYVGAHHGMEWITSALLLKFTEEFCQSFRKKAAACRYPIEYIFESRSLHIIPMLNPDGVDMSINKSPPSGILDERLIRMNGGSGDFSRWQANGRGVDLNHNYSAGFAEYKSSRRKTAYTTERLPATAVNILKASRKSPQSPNSFGRSAMSD